MKIFVETAFLGAWLPRRINFMIKNSVPPIEHNCDDKNDSDIDEIERICISTIFGEDDNDDENKKKVVKKKRKRKKKC